jgi:hypothetical protein
VVRASPLAFAFGAIVLLPFAFVCCRSSSSDVAPVDTGSRLVPNPDQNPSPLTVTTGADAASLPVADASPLSSASATPTALSPKAKCEQTRRNVNALIAQSRACRVDADCTQMFTSCGLPGVCGISVAKGTESKIKAAEQPWDAASCVLVTTAPCPTCTVPAPPKCVSGKCE